EDKPAGTCSDKATGNSGQDEAAPGINVEVDLQDRRAIRAGAEKKRMAEGELPTITTQQVPGLAEVGIKQRKRQPGDPKIGLNEQRHRSHHQAEDDDCRQIAHGQTRCPSRPFGLNNSTTMKIRKMPSWPRLSPRNNPPRLSVTPIIRPPSRAPTKLPIPPSTTTVKATSTKACPTWGLT